MKISVNDMKKIKAGASVSGALINYAIKGFNAIIDAGRYVGSAIRRMVSGSYCPTK